MTVKRKTTRTKKEKPKIKRTSQKITKQQSDKVEKKKDKLEPFGKGDFCYYLDANNKVRLGEVQSAHEQDGNFHYQLIDQHEFRYITVPHEYCSDDKAGLKGAKRK